MKAQKTIFALLLIAILPAMSFKYSFKEPGLTKHAHDREAVATSFKRNPLKEARTRYAFATSMEQVQDQRELNFLVSNIVEINCSDANAYSVALQFDEYYQAQYATSSNNLYMGGKNTTGWIYNTYDEAVASRRNSMANTRLNKKNVSEFYFTCKN